MKEKIETGFPNINKHYRIIYNLFSTIGLLYILFYLATTPSKNVLPKNEYLQLTGLILSTLGLIVIKQAFKQYSIREFLGLQRRDDQKKQSFDTSGILNHIRHPIYTGTIMVVAGFFLFNTKLLMLVTLICVVIYIVIGIRFEEKKLIQEFGHQYVDYKKQVPALIPRISFWKN